eukprot:264456-Chlamydomonas_euryale.AAC.10
MWRTYVRLCRPFNYLFAISRVPGGSCCRPPTRYPAASFPPHPPPNPNPKPEHPNPDRYPPTPHRRSCWRPPTRCPTASPSTQTATSRARCSRAPVGCCASSQKAQATATAAAAGAAAAAAGKRLRSCGRARRSAAACTCARSACRSLRRAAAAGRQTPLRAARPTRRRLGGRECDARVCLRVVGKGGGGRSWCGIGLASTGPVSRRPGGR